jgi:FkbM family methyltransferase
MLPVPKRNIIEFKDNHSGYTFFGVNSPCTDFIIENGVFEYDIITWCKQFLSKEGTFIDIGSHLGSYSIILHEYCKRVVAFDAQAVLYTCLQKGIEKNKIKNIDAHCTGLSNETKENIPIYTNINWIDGGGASCIKPTEENQYYKEYINITTLDSFSIDNIDLIKIDAEGFELYILEGSTETLKRNNYPPVLYEANTKEDCENVKKFMYSLGYNNIKTVSSNMFFIEKTI